MAEEDYRSWINSIEFVDEDGQVIETELKKDRSVDHENDRDQFEEG